MTFQQRKAAWFCYAQHLAEVALEIIGQCDRLHDRMPVILDKADFGAWLSGTGGAELLRSAADDKLRMRPISRRVNKTGSGDDDPSL